MPVRKDVLTKSISVSEILSPVGGAGRCCSARLLLGRRQPMKAQVGRVLCCEAVSQPVLASQQEDHRCPNSHLPCESLFRSGFQPHSTTQSLGGRAYDCNGAEQFHRTPNSVGNDIH